MNPRPNMKCRLPMPPELLESPGVAFLLNALNAEFFYVNAHVKTRYEVVDFRIVPASPIERIEGADVIPPGVEVWMRKDPVPPFAVRRTGWSRVKPLTREQRDTPVYEVPEGARVLTAEQARAEYIRNTSEPPSDDKLILAEPVVDPTFLQAVIADAIAAATGQKIAKAVPPAITKAVMDFFGVEEGTPVSVDTEVDITVTETRAQGTIAFPTAPDTLESPEPFQPPAQAPEPAPEPEPQPAEPTEDDDDV